HRRPYAHHGGADGGRGLPPARAPPGDVPQDRRRGLRVLRAGRGGARPEPGPPATAAGDRGPAPGQVRPLRRRRDRPAPGPRLRDVRLAGRRLGPGEGGHDPEPELPVLGRAGPGRMTRPDAVAIVCDYRLDYLGGAQTALLEQARALAGSGRPVLLVAPTDPPAGAELPPGVRLLRVPARAELPGLRLPLLRNTAALRG